MKAIYYSIFFGGLLSIFVTGILLPESSYIFPLVVVSVLTIHLIAWVVVMIRGKL